MADNYTPEEIQAIIAEYNNALRAGAPISRDLAERLKDAAAGVVMYSQAVKQATNQLGTSIKGLVQNMANGAQGAAQFNDALSSGADLASTALQKFGPFGKALGLATQGLAAYVGAVNKQADALYKSYQDISRSGISTGMDSIYTNLQKFGYGLDEADKMGALFRDNAKALTQFTKTANAGATQLGDLAAGIKNSDLQRQFMNLGMSVDDIARGSAGYLLQQGRLGKTTEATTKGAAEYIRQMEILTRLTGQSAKEMEDQREAALQMDEFMAGIADMPVEAQKQAMAAINRLNAQDPSGKLARGFASSVNGIIGSTQESMDLFNATSGESVTAAQDLAKNLINVDQYLQRMRDAMAPNIALQKDLSKIGANYMGSLATNMRFVNKGLMPFADQTADATKQVDAMAAGADAATDTQSRLRIAQMNARDSMQDFVNLGINPVTKAMQILAEVIEKLTSWLPGAGSARKRFNEEERTRKMSAPPTGSILDRIIQVESGGDYKAHAKTSTAYGLGQFTKGTFEDLAAKKDSTVRGKSWEEYKSDPALQRQALEELTSRNQAQLQKNNIPVTAASTYLAHFLGAGGASNVLKAGDNADLASAVTPEQMAANKNVFKDLKTVGDLKNWAAKKMGDVPATGTTHMAGKMPAYTGTGVKDSEQSDWGNKPAIVVGNKTNITTDKNRTGYTKTIDTANVSKDLEETTETMAKKQQEAFKAMQENPNSNQVASNEQPIATAQLSRLDDLNDNMRRLVDIQSRSLKMQS